MKAQTHPYPQLIKVYLFLIYSVPQQYIALSFSLSLCSLGSKTNICIINLKDDSSRQPESPLLFIRFTHLNALTRIHN